MQDGGGRGGGKRNLLVDRLSKIVTWDRVSHEREQWVHPRDRWEINSRCLYASIYIYLYTYIYIHIYVRYYVAPLRGVEHRVHGRGEDENGTVIAKGRGWRWSARDSRDRCSRSPRKMTYWMARRMKRTLRCVNAIDVRQTLSRKIWKWKEILCNSRNCSSF